MSVIFYFIITFLIVEVFSIILFVVLFKEIESLKNDLTIIKKQISDLSLNFEDEKIKIRRLISDTNKEITMVERTLSSSIDNKIKNV